MKTLVLVSTILVSDLAFASEPLEVVKLSANKSIGGSFLDYTTPVPIPPFDRSNPLLPNVTPRKLGHDERPSTFPWRPNITHSAAGEFLPYIKH